VKCVFFSLQFRNQFFGPVNRDLIAYCEKYSPISLNGFINLDTLLTHGTRLKITGGKQPATCYLMTAAGLFCFNWTPSG
jgi:hypothetical protein